MEIIVRASVVFFVLWFLVRVLGKREMSQLTALELVLLVTMGDLVQQGVTQEDMSVTGAALSVGTIAMWILIFSYASFKWRHSRRVIEGFPVLIVHNGELLDEIVRLERLTRDEVRESAREQGIDDLRKVRYGILEANGHFSFVTDEAQHQQPEKLAE